MTVRREARAEPPHPESRDRLLDAAERLFADRGYAAASVRDITAAAGCNVAAINYYFGGKDKLYREVFRRGLSVLRRRLIESIRETMTDAGGVTTLERLLEAFTSAFLETAVDPGNDRRLMELLAREWMDPHVPRDVFQDEMVGPVREALADALQTTCPGLERTRARLCVQSIIAQLVQVIHHRRLFGTSGEWARVPLRLDEVADHIVRFSAAGTRAYAGKSPLRKSSSVSRARRR
jgi:AcrR family transcriptional regulator